MGKRPFDLPILPQGEQPNPKGNPVAWFTQPMAQTPVSSEQMEELYGIPRKYGYRIVDPHPRNLGIFRGWVYLLGLWAVRCT